MLQPARAFVPCVFFFVFLGCTPQIFRCPCLASGYLSCAFCELFHDFPLMYSYFFFLHIQTTNMIVHAHKTVKSTPDTMSARHHLGVPLSSLVAHQVSCYLTLWTFPPKNTMLIWSFNLPGINRMLYTYCSANEMKCGERPAVIGARCIDQCQK